MECLLGELNGRTAGSNDKRRAARGAAAVVSDIAPVHGACAAVCDDAGAVYRTGNGIAHASGGATADDDA